MDLPTAVVSVLDPDSMCRACFKELNIATATEASARVNMFEMPELVDKLSACISSIFTTNSWGSKYLCLVCFERVNEFYEFREMCLQSIRRFEETQTYNEEPIKSEGTNDILLSSESVIKKEYEVHDVNHLPEIVEGPLENHVVQFNKESIGTESMVDILHSSESVVKEEFQLHEQALDSNRVTTILPEVVNNSPQIFQNSLEIQVSQFNKESIETKGTNDISPPIDWVVKEEYKLHEQPLASNRDVSAKNESVSECTLDRTFSNGNIDSKHRSNTANKRRRSNTGSFGQMPLHDLETVEIVKDKPIYNEVEELSSENSQNATSSPNIQMSLDDLEAAVSVRNEPISNESEEELSSDHSRNTAATTNVHKDSQKDVSGESEHGIRRKTTYTASETTQKPAMGRTGKRKTFSCGKCHKFFRKEMKFIAHIQAHEGLKPYHCTYDGCVKSFTTPEYLKKHQKRHENSNSEHVPKRFQCEYEGCDKSFRWPYSAKRHRMMHEYQNMGHDPPICCTYDGCDQTFSRFSGLKRHQNWHADANSEHGLKRYYCTHEGCDKAYASPLNLKRHQERHENLNNEHGHKRYHCTHEGCDKSYAWPSDLKLHERRHTHPKMYRCKKKGCDKSYLWACGLRRHLNLGCQPE